MTLFVVKFFQENIFVKLSTTVCLFQYDGIVQKLDLYSFLHLIIRKRR